MSRTRTPTEKQRQEFRRDLYKLVNEMVLRLGGRPTTDKDKLGRMYAFVVPTNAGPVLLDPYDDCIMGRFTDVAEGVKAMGRDAINPHTGKWNHHAYYGKDGAETWANIAALVPHVENRLRALQGSEA